MILVDTSVWVDHLRRGNGRLAALLDDGVVVFHPFVIGELACGTLRQRGSILSFLDAGQATARRSARTRPGAVTSRPVAAVLGAERFVVGDQDHRLVTASVHPPRRGETTTRRHARFTWRSNWVSALAAPGRE